MNQQGSISLENNSDRYNIEQAQFLKISDVADGDNGTLYRCTVSYFNNRNRTSLAQESDHFHLLFKQKEGNIYTYTNRKKEQKVHLVFCLEYEKSSSNGRG